MTADCPDTVTVPVTGTFLVVDGEVFGLDSKGRWITREEDTNE